MLKNEREIYRFQLCEDKQYVKLCMIKGIELK